VRLFGVFALWADGDPPGAEGAVVELLAGEEVAVRKTLLAGAHYADAKDPGSSPEAPGDGLSIEPVSCTRIGEATYRVDELTVDVPPGCHADAVRFRDLGTPASFVLFDVAFAYEAATACPFRGLGDAVSLADLACIVRVGDQAGFERALLQMQTGIEMTAGDLDESRSLGLLFLAVVSAGLIERGAKRDLHRLQLDAARRLERLRTKAGIAQAAAEMAREAVAGTGGASKGDQTIQRALAYIERHFAEPLTDAALADAANMSTSHFRHLFRRTTGQAVHTYIVSLRLERARQMLLRQDATVAEVARRVGFPNPAHFSRAFAKRFGGPPSSVRETRL
jgi:AraC-like DNA-binding protein